MVEKSVLEKIIDNTPFALVLIGVFLLLTGAAGGWPSLSIQVNSLGWQITLVVIGLAVGGIGSLMLWQERNQKTKRKGNLPNPYGIKIISHDNQTRVEEVAYAFQLSGSYETEFPEASLMVFVRHDNVYWPASRPGDYRAAGGNWQTRVQLGGRPGPRLIIVAIVGKYTLELCRNYWKEGDEHDNWPAIKTSNDDITECDRVVVNKSS